VPYLVDLPTFSDERGSLTVVERILPFEIRRVYYIYHATGKRGGHRHKRTIQALISVAGRCEVFVDNGQKQETFVLDVPNRALILEPQDWHTMENFSRDCVLLVLASEYYDRSDYIDEGYSG